MPFEKSTRMKDWGSRLHYRYYYTEIPFAYLYYSLVFSFNADNWFAVCSNSKTWLLIMDRISFRLQAKGFKEKVNLKSDLALN